MTEKRLHEQLAEMNLHGMSKCELLNMLAGTECHTSCTWSAEDVTPCKEHREAQRDALIRRILEEYEPKHKNKLGALYEWVNAGMEGCDEPEFTLYDSIAAAIETYWFEKKYRALASPVMVVKK